MSLKFDRFGPSHVVANLLDVVFVLILLGKNSIRISLTNKDFITAAALLTLSTKHIDLLCLLIEENGRIESSFRDETRLHNCCPFICLKVEKHYVIKNRLC